MFEKIISRLALPNFLSVELTSVERSIAIESVKHKYARALRRTVFFSLLSIFPVLFLDTSVIITVLIPITMVAGTAWFSISLANMKQKFDKFWLELTTNLFEAFSISLWLLFILSVFSLWEIYTQNLVWSIGDLYILQLISFLIWVFVVGNIIYKIFIGSIQYDINDAMLTGQNEAAERFFRKSLSLLHSLSSSLRSGGSLQVSNYYIWVAFFEIYSYVENLSIDEIDTAKFKDISNKLIKNPSMSQLEADNIAIELISQFLSYCINPQWYESKKSLEAINDEMDSMRLNPNEEQQMKDTRLGVVFAEIANLLEWQGETLFKK